MVLGKNFDQELLGKIKEEHLKPWPKWYFVLKNIFIWLLLAWFLLFGGLAMSLIIFIFRYDGWNLIIYSQRVGLKIILMTVPIFWILLLVFSTLLAYWNYRYTKRGYKYSAHLIIPVSIVTSLILGGIFFQAGFGEKIDNILSRRPMYSRFINPGIKSWSKPQEGRLAGLLLQKENQPGYFLLERNKKQWLIEIEDKNFPESLPPMGLPVRLLGKQTSENSFRANVVMPLKPGRGYFDDDRRPNLPPPPMFNK